jgi:hypothetical protein
VQAIVSGREYTMRVQYTDEAVVVGVAHEVAPEQTLELLADAILAFDIGGAIPESIVGCGHAVLNVLKNEVPEAYALVYEELCNLVNGS